MPLTSPESAKLRRSIAVKWMAMDLRRNWKRGDSWVASKGLNRLSASHSVDFGSIGEGGGGTSG